MYANKKICQAKKFWLTNAKRMRKFVRTLKDRPKKAEAVMRTGEGKPPHLRAQLIRERREGDMRWFLLCYLCFQTGALVGTLIWHDKNPEDRVMSVLFIAATTMCLLWFYVWSGLFA